MEHIVEMQVKRPHVDEPDEIFISSFLKLTRTLPNWVKLIVDSAPDKFKIPTFIALLPMLGTLATRVRFRYPFDMGPSAFLFQVLVEGPQSGGKSFARYICQLIMHQQEERDMEQLRKEQEYKELRRKAKNRKEQPSEPHVMRVMVNGNISVVMLVKLADAPMRYFGGKITLLDFADEVSIVVEANKRAFSNLTYLLRTAFDLDSYFSLDYLSENSYSAKVDLMMNTLFCGTSNAIDSFMTDKNIEGGSVTRCIHVELDTELGDEPPVFKPLSKEQKDGIDRFVARIMSGTYNTDGTIKPEIPLSTEWLYPTVKQWCEQMRLECVTKGSEAMSVFYKRASVSAFRAAALMQYLYMLEDLDESAPIDNQMTFDHAPSPKIKKRVKAIYLFMARYILDGMLKRWGGRFEELSAKRLEVQNRQGKHDLFGSLPQEFTRDLLKEQIDKLKLTTPSKTFVSKWYKLGLIDKLGKNLFRKTGSVGKSKHVASKHSSSTDPK